MTNKNPDLTFRNDGYETNLLSFIQGQISRSQYFDLIHQFLFRLGKWVKSFYERCLGFQPPCWCKGLFFQRCIYLKARGGEQSIVLRKWLRLSCSTLLWLSRSDRAYSVEVKGHLNMTARKMICSDIRLRLWLQLVVLSLCWAERRTVQAGFHSILNSNVPFQVVFQGESRDPCCLRGISQARCGEAPELWINGFLSLLLANVGAHKSQEDRLMTDWDPKGKRR